MSRPDRVAKESLSILRTIPKGSLPLVDREWTVFSAICEEGDGGHFRVVAAGTGTRCLGPSQMRPQGDLLHDSHAEIICLRAFKRYILTEMINCSEGKESMILDGSLEEGFTIKPHIKYHLFTSHPPCGDASIFPVKSEDSEEPPTKKLKIVDESSFTGAKLIGQDTADVMAQDEGALRTKPGRGERTLSMSCSDKLAKVLIMGVQGGMLSSLLKSPIYLESIILSANSGYHRDSLERALYKRFSNSTELSSGPFHLRIPSIEESTLSFPYPKDDDKSPCPKTIIWSRVDHKPLDISVDGRRQGVAKKNISHPSSRLKVCRVEMFKEFQRLLKKKHPELEETIAHLSYKETLDKYSTSYQSFWGTVKEKYFKKWTVKPKNLKDFTTDQNKTPLP